ncbi:MAG: glycosyltransferase, partial [Anaerolineales bacterium]|nr:glycosyltransferase [Anaerolineales bacterium]
ARARIPHGIWALGSDIWSLGGVPLVRGVLRDVLRSAAWRFADGYQLAADVSALSGLDCAFLPSTRVLPLPGEKQLAGAPPYKLAFLGRWHPHKGVDLLLESLQLLEDADWQRIAAVQICGGGPLEPLVQAQGAALGGNGRPVTIRGYLNRAEAAELLTWADYLLLPSRIESIPVIFSDAMQARCPVVAMPVGDLPRLMESDDAGILVQHVTAEALATGIRRALAAAPVQFEPGLRRLRAQFDLPRAVSQLTAQVL